MQFPRILPRRAFLARLAAWGGAVAILPSLFAKGANAARPGYGVRTVTTMPGGPPNRTLAAAFEPHVNSAFWIVTGPKAAPRPVELISVTRSETLTMPTRRPTSSTPAFSLIFAAQGRALPQDTYRVEHPELGVFPLFLVPIGPNQAQVHYQAVFA